MVVRPPPKGAAPSFAPTELARYFIDAWAVDDGALFASRRNAQSDIWQPADGVEVDTYLLTAPDFDAVFVPRSLAYGAVRRGSQEGFSLDGQTEVEFSSLAQLRELARRAYVAGAIGDGGPEGGGQPDRGPEPPDGGPSMPDALRAQARVPDRWTRRLADAIAVLELDGDADGGEVGRPALRDALNDAIDERVSVQAALLLLRTAEHAIEPTVANYGSIPLARTFVHLAASLVEPSQHRKLLNGIRSDASLARLFFYVKGGSLPLRYVFELQALARVDVLGLLGEAALPRMPALSSMNLPPRCRTWIDVYQYLSADRRYYELGKNGHWLPLAVCVAAIVASPRMPVDSWSDWRLPVQRKHRAAWQGRIADIVASMVPARGLPTKVEQWLRDRCWQHQRNHPQPSTA